MTSFVSFNDYRKNILNTKNQDNKIVNHDLNIVLQNKNDIVEIHSKTKNCPKFKKFLVLGGILASIVSIIVVARLSRLSKIKKDVIKCYDEIFDLIKSSCRDLNFEKPKLEFRKFAPQDNTGACYDLSKNKIYMNTATLNPKNVFKKIGQDKLVPMQEINDDTLMAYLYRVKDKTVNDIQATYDEFLFDTGGVLAHELTHAKQFQQMLCAQGIKEKFIEGICEAQKLDIENKRQVEEIKKTFSFVFNYKPKKITTMETTHKIAGKCASLSYSNRSTLENYFNYIDTTAPNKSDYYLNPLEITAEIAKEDYIKGVIEGKILKHLNLDKMTLHASQIAAEYNSLVLVDNF